METCPPSSNLQPAWLKDRYLSDIDWSLPNCFSLSPIDLISTSSTFQPRPTIPPIPTDVHLKHTVNLKPTVNLPADLSSCLIDWLIPLSLDAARLSQLLPDLRKSLAERCAQQTRAPNEPETLDLPACWSIYILPLAWSIYPSWYLLSLHYPRAFLAPPIDCCPSL